MSHQRETFQGKKGFLGRRLTDSEKHSTVLIFNLILFENIGSGFDIKSETVFDLRGLQRDKVFLFFSFFSFSPFSSVNTWFLITFNLTNIRIRVKSTFTKESLLIRVRFIGMSGREEEKELITGFFKLKNKENLSIK